ncbi:t-cell surface glycoprotein cd3 epsilon chain [Limosa lapponica baueri]|uniref:T-cell surface glycoprotein cd3 epsilon chain n=1 Tax=Limosa lapponica baueri TaxID=1758121 RepID=A0A2I0TUT2_LIMLA|nr:t-cell surface glycoprotein cd3 epsilon chain [Limosa lapponica baueri]
MSQAFRWLCYTVVPSAFGSLRDRGFLQETAFLLAFAFCEGCQAVGTAAQQENIQEVKVCANCEELDALAVTGIITADLLITFGVLILVYYFSKDRKGKASTSAGSRPRGQKVQRPPPVPNPDYEPIRKGQREVYAGLESRGF